jgi:hypothetical protein
MRIQLIDNWQHPLTEEFEIDGIPAVNNWGFASQLVALATGRITNDHCPRKMAIDALKDLGVNDVLGYKDDAAYLKLVNECWCALERKLDEEFGG